MSKKAQNTSHFQTHLNQAIVELEEIEEMLTANGPILRVFADFSDEIIKCLNNLNARLQKLEKQKEKKG